MSFEIEYDNADNVVRLRAKGVLDRRSIEEAFAQVEHLTLRPGYRELVDLRAVRQFDVTAPYLRRVALDYSRARQGATPGARSAIVASTNVGYGMARMFEMARGAETDDELRVFRNVREARAWLGIERRRTC